MNKIISFVLCAFCAVCMLSVSVSADEEKETAYGVQSVEKLTALGVLTGFSTDAESLLQNVTRGEICKILVELSGDNSLFSDTDTVYRDVPSSHENYQYIMASSAMGYVSGRADGNFAPDEGVTVLDALKMLLSVLGYDEYAIARGGYPKGYIETAQATGLLRKIGNLSVSDCINRGVLAQICDEAVDDVALMKLSGMGETSLYESERGTTLLFQKHNIKKDKNILSANEFTSIYSRNGKTQEGFIKMGDSLYQYAGNNQETLLGQYCKYYYNEEKGEVLYISPLSSNEVTEIEAEQIRNVSGSVISYENGNTEEKVHIEGSASVIINGVCSASYSDAELFPTVGHVTLIDNNGDGKIDVAKVLSFDTYVVDKVDVRSKVIYDKFGKAPLRLGADEENYIIRFGGQTVGIDALEEWDVLEVGADKMKYTPDGMRADMDQSDFYYILALNDKVIGSLTEVSQTFCKIEGVEFDVDRHFYQNEKIGAFSVGESGSFLLGYGDRIVAARYDDKNEILYAFLFNARKTSGVADEMQFELFDQSGKYAVYQSARKINFNNEIRLSPSEVYARLTGTESNGNKEVGQLIKFRVNAKGQLSELYTYTDKTKIKGYQGYSEDEFTKDFIVDNLVYRAGNQRLFAGKYQINTGLIVFYIPMTGTKAEKQYAQIKDSSYFEGNIYYSNVAFYDVTKKRSVKVAVVTPSVASMFTNESPVMLVENVASAVLPDGSTGYKINGYAEGKKLFVSVDDATIKDKGDWGQITKTVRELSKGDVIQYETDVNDMLLSFRVLFSKNSNTVYFEKAAGGSVEPNNYYAVLYTGYGKIREVNETNIIFNGNTDNPDLLCADPAWDRTIPFAGTVYQYDAKTNRITIADKSELFEGNDVFVYTHLTNTKEIILYVE